ncbi:MAG: helix-turn-helix transcriptional regulator [Propionibacteriaceae bacterium]|jgi:transcriptional regulator with XRE-family HTH domain|nr:helix-turn-helix transcriptional regulator [Propionibacteriaceae bacterium]
MDDPWEPYRTAVNAQLRAEIGAAGISVSEFCRRTRIPRPTLDRYLNGTRDMPLKVLHRAGLALDVEPAVILARADERRRSRPTA